MGASHLTTGCCLCLLVGCSSAENKDVGFGTTPEDTGSETFDTGPDGLVGEEVHSPRDKANDILWDGDSLYYSTEYDPAIVLWDPQTDSVENVAWDFRDLEAFTVRDGSFFGSFSDSGIEGWVSEILPPKGEDEWASQATDGTLFRRPNDLILENETLYVVDNKVNVLWELAGKGGSVKAIASTDSLLCVTASSGELLMGGEEGIYALDGSLVDSRPALALGERDGQAYAIHPSEGLFEVGGEAQWALNGPPRPGQFVWRNDTLYVIDEVGGGIWRYVVEP